MAILRQGYVTLVVWGCEIRARTCEGCACGGAVCSVQDCSQSACFRSPGVAQRHPGIFAGKPNANERRILQFCVMRLGRQLECEGYSVRLDVANDFDPVEQNKFRRIEW